MELQELADLVERERELEGDHKARRGITAASTWRARNPRGSTCAPRSASV
jgi:hypothetical protein